MSTEQEVIGPDHFFHDEQNCSSCNAYLNRSREFDQLNQTYQATQPAHWISGRKVTILRQLYINLSTGPGPRSEK